MQAPARKRGRLWTWVVAGCGVLLVLIIGAVIAGYLLAPRIQDVARGRVENILQERFHSSVEFSNFYVDLYPRIRLTITDLVLRHKGRTDIPPLIQIQKVTIDSALLELWGPRHRVQRVQIVGLQIHMPPRNANGPPLIHGTSTDLAKKYPIFIEEMDADNALVVLLRKPQDADKPPNQFEIHQLVMRDFSFDQPANFHALLTNPKPRGEIHCDGQFGPWRSDEPSQTPVRAHYTFEHADLGTLKGISGILSSVGKFSGPLDYLNVEGTTDTPDFAVRTSGHPVPLHTDFTAIVDGTNGNTILTNVTAKFRHTTIVTRGEVVDVYKNVKGRTISLEAASNNAQLEDLLNLAVKSDQPVMTGSARLHTKILIPERDEDLIDRMQLNGQFALADLHFTSDQVQDKVDSLSRKGQGEPNDFDIADMMSGLDGKFTMKKGTLDFTNLDFAVEGASITLGGTYDVDDGQMDFRGKLRLQAKLSQTMTGWKSVVLKPFDHFFKGKDGGTEIPIRIAGTREHLHYGADFHDKDKAELENSSKASTQ